MAYSPPLETKVPDIGDRSRSPERIFTPEAADNDFTPVPLVRPPVEVKQHTGKCVRQSPLSDEDVTKLLNDLTTCRVQLQKVLGVLVSSDKNSRQSTHRSVENDGKM